jgi:molybdate transport system substrate-binding protein
MPDRTHASGRLWRLLALGLLLSQGCQGDGTKAARTEISVFAASSLSEAFTDLAREFEDTQQDVDVRLIFAGSQILRVQIEHGATADLYASANQEHMEALLDSGLISGAVTFARNELVIIVPKDNPAGIVTFDDLPHAKSLVVGTDDVPIGTYTREVLRRAASSRGPAFARQVRGHIVSKESNVRLVRSKIELGEADAALVYRTDAEASDRVDFIPIPNALNAHATYQIGLTVESRHEAEATAFQRFVVSQRGRSILRRRGFLLEDR